MDQPASFDAGSLGRISMLLIAGIADQQLAGKIIALAAESNIFFHGTGSHGAGIFFAMESHSFCRHAAIALAGLLPFAACAIQAAIGCDQGFLLFLLA